MTRSEAIAFFNIVCREVDAYGPVFERANEAMLALGVTPDELLIAGFGPELDEG